jgi:hypothetical protein
MSIAFDEQRTERTDDARIRSVDLIQYRELLVSRRKLERVRSRVRRDLRVREALGRERGAKRLVS